MVKTTSPLLVVITGKPGSGKSTLARELAAVLRYPLVSRDQIKQAMLIKLGQTHFQADPDINEKVNFQFLTEVSQWLENGECVIAEAAFQNKIWAAWTEAIPANAAIRLLICEVSSELAMARFDQRRRLDPDRIQFHGDDPESSHQLIKSYQRPELDLPTLNVDTTQGYLPELEAINTFCR